MAANTTRQYRPVSTAETSADDGMSVRVLHEIADGINNYAEHVAKFPLGSQLCKPHWRSHATTAEERIIALFVGRRLPPSMDTLQFCVGHALESGATGTCQWNLYVHGFPYSGGDVVMDTSKLGPYDSATITTDSTNHTITFTEGPPEIYRGNGLTYATLTATNSDATTRAALTSIQIWPYKS